MLRYGLIDADYAMRLRQTAADADGPFYTLGLRRLRPGTDAGSRGVAGTHRDAEHTQIPLLSAVGAALCLVASVVAGSPDWDRIAVVGYPSRRSFLSLVDRREVRDWHVRQQHSTEEFMVLGTLPTGGLPPTDSQRLLLEVWNGPEPAALVTGPATRFEVEGTVIGDGRQWSGVRYTPIELGTVLPLHPPRFGYQALLLTPVLERWR